MDINTKKETNYKRWSFRFLIYYFLVNAVIIYQTINFANGFDDAERFNLFLNLISIIASFILLTGSVLTILSVLKKESKNYQYYLSVIAYPIIIILNVLSLF